jgi:hypothetical protein
MELKIIDTQTGEYPDVAAIALKEEWAKHLIYCDIDGFYMGEDGNLMLIDDCDNAATCPSGRFKVTIENDGENKQLNEELISLRKYYSVTNSSWKKLVDENTELKKKIDRLRELITIKRGAR